MHGRSATLTESTPHDEPAGRDLLSLVFFTGLIVTTFLV